MAKGKSKCKDGFSDFLLKNTMTKSAVNFTLYSQFPVYNINDQMKIYFFF